MNNLITGEDQTTLVRIVLAMPQNNKFQLFSEQQKIILAMLRQLWVMCGLEKHKHQINIT